MTRLSNAFLFALTCFIVVVIATDLQVYASATPERKEFQLALIPIKYTLPLAVWLIASAFARWKPGASRMKEREE